MVHLLTALCLLFFGNLGGIPPKSADPVRFVIIVPSFNNESVVERNLDSLFCQKSTLPFQVIYVNDCSTDKTGSIAEAYARNHGLTEAQFTIIRNKRNVGTGTENIYNVVTQHVEDHKVVVCIDGDDFLSFSGVLTRLEQEYADPDVWMTFGRFVVYPSGEIWTACQGYPHEVMQEGRYREHSNVPSHLKTFRARLLKKVKRESLCDSSGKFYPKAGDMALMFPLLEMCSPYEPNGLCHWRYIEDTIMYIYNFTNPLSDGATDKGRE
jgi:glycosyltransferase involved in cell wall biosynthesis